MSMQPPAPEDASFLQSAEEPLLLMAPRGADRRLLQEDGPPWVTDEGFVLDDRRSGDERRSPK